MELPWKISLLDGVRWAWDQGCGAVEKDSCCPTCRVCHVGLVSRVGYTDTSKRSLTCQVWMFDDVCIVRSLEKRHVVCKLSHRLQESYIGFAHGAISMTVAVLSHQTLWNSNSTPSVSSGKNGSVVKWLPSTNNQLPKPQKSCITIQGKVGIPTSFKEDLKVIYISSVQVFLLNVRKGIQSPALPSNQFLLFFTQPAAQQHRDITRFTPQSCHPLLLSKPTWKIQRSHCALHIVQLQVRSSN